MTKRIITISRELGSYNFYSSETCVSLILQNKKRWDLRNYKIMK